MAKKKVAKCKKCRHSWEPRVRNPDECPRCKSRSWNKGGKRR